MAHRGDRRARKLAPLFFHQALNALGSQLRIILFDEVFNLSWLDAQGLKVSCETLPVLLSLLPFGQIKLGHQFLGSLQCDTLAIIIIAADNVLLISREVAHRFPFIFYLLSLSFFAVFPVSARPSVFVRPLERGCPRDPLLQPINYRQILRSIWGHFATRRGFVRSGPYIFGRLGSSLEPYGSIATLCMLAGLYASPRLSGEGNRSKVEKSTRLLARPLSLPPFKPIGRYGLGTALNVDP